MGCTSSAPNSVSAHANKEEKSIQFKEEEAETQPRHDAINTESEPRTEIKVLPPSDTIVEIAEPVQIIRNNRSTTSLEPEKDLLSNGHSVANDQIDTSEVMKEENEDKIAKLEEVVGKFIGITQQDTNPDKNTHEATAGCIKEDNNEETVLKMENESRENDGEDKNNSEETEKASPSQSQSSRATRWEALADIAAELPPSLAVDPLTGQIYSLSK